LTSEMAAHVVLEVTYAEPGVSDTASNVTKSATPETGAEIKVPIFINQETKIKIDTRTGDYLEKKNEIRYFIEYYFEISK
ncbi:MAG: hypothetical protein IPK46_14185, partial [Saprospiraceae bacterium]|nr:hypothetical protein [Saprospiraceae bacterium]